ncbi:redox-sensitive transcriptional activator SoxR [Streptomyces silvisoli]|uniref:Redox-sensitive transcriptional activator SoxR n=1 Tax=Streptomyces silvisoli TaxID=3034235 RepID=A0ABT5ZNI3_9ACTN|nr:redox-sensitive transcriptional activator SoxR [Streptomyces silvisoli]MDF3291393.1 redox-sensitive transcriptional activator SoxR [Streptomyces silvisoli]
MSGVSWQAKELTIGELSERSGVPASAPRFYERRGLIDSSRTSGNQRRCARDTLRRVAFIRVSQGVGMPLATIREALALLPEGRTPSKEDWACVSEHWRQDLTERIRQMTMLLEKLTDRIGCGCLTLERCALANPCDVLGQQGSGARRFEGQTVRGSEPAIAPTGESAGTPPRRPGLSGGTSGLPSRG